MIHERGEEKELSDALSLSNSSTISVAGLGRVPSIILRAGDDAVQRFIEFFTATHVPGYGHHGLSGKRRYN
jgi:hypothetical protein